MCSLQQERDLQPLISFPVIRHSPLCLCKSQKSRFPVKTNLFIERWQSAWANCFISREYAKYFLVGKVFFDEKEKKRRKEGHSGICQCHCVLKNNKI